MSDKIQEIDTILDELDRLQGKYADFKEYVRTWLEDQEESEKEVRR